MYIRCIFVSYVQLSRPRSTRRFPTINAMDNENGTMRYQRGLARSVFAFTVVCFLAAGELLTIEYLWRPSGFSGRGFLPSSSRVAF